MVKTRILNAAIKLANKKGYRNITRDCVAHRAKVSPALVNHYFGTIRQLQKCVLIFAIENRVHNLIVQGLTLRDPLALKIPSWLKEYSCTTVYTDSL